MLFEYNPQIIFVNYRLNKLNLSFFRGYNIQSDYIVGTMCSQLLLQFYGDSLKHYRCFGHGLKICMWFGYNL